MSTMDNFEEQFVNTEVGGGAEPRLNIRLIGSMRISDASRSLVDLRGRKARAVLAVLALSSGPVLRDTLAKCLWSTRHRDQGRSSLRHSVYEIQDVLQDAGKWVFESEKHYLKLNLGFVNTDVQELNKSNVARPHALKLLTAELLEDLYGIDTKFDEWLQVERQRVTAHAKLLASNILKQSSDPAKLIIAAEYTLKNHTGTRELWNNLIDSYRKIGQFDAAAIANERFRVAFQDDEEATLEDRATSLSTILGQSKVAILPQNPSLSFLEKESTFKGIKIAVLHFRSFDIKSEPIARGLTDELLNAFLRFSEIRCFSPLDVSNYVPGIESFRNLGADYIVEGSVQSSENSTRITARLVDPSNHSEIIWSQKFDCGVKDALILQTDIASQIVAQIDPKIIAKRGQEVENSFHTQPTSVQLVLRAIPAISKLERLAFFEAGRMLSTAVNQDAYNGAAHAWLAYWNLLLLGQGWASNPVAAEVLTWELAKRAIALDPGDARALTLAGHVQAFTHRRLDEAFTLHERALSINPSLPIAWLFSGLAHTYAGLHEEAVRRIRHAKQLSPLDPHEFFFDMGLTLSLSLNGDDHSAIKHGRSAAEINPMFSSTFKAYLSALGFAGDQRTTEEVLGHLLHLEPGFNTSIAMKRSPLSRSEDRQKFLDGLKRSGLPDS